MEGTYTKGDHIRTGNSYNIYKDGNSQRENLYGKKLMWRGRGDINKKQFIQKSHICKEMHEEGKDPKAHAEGDSGHARKKGRETYTVIKLTQKGDTGFFSSPTPTLGTVFFEVPAALGIFFLKHQLRWTQSFSEAPAALESTSFLEH